MTDTETRRRLIGNVVHSWRWNKGVNDTELADRIVKALDDADRKELEAAEEWPLEDNE